MGWLIALFFGFQIQRHARYGFDPAFGLIIKPTLLHVFRQVQLQPTSTEAALAEPSRGIEKKILLRDPERLKVLSRAQHRDMETLIDKLYANRA
jgi:hypothetical protein